MATGGADRRGIHLPYIETQESLVQALSFGTYVNLWSMVVPEAYPLGIIESSVAVANPEVMGEC